MALLAVYDEHATPVHLLACTERHHIVSHDLSFIDYELVIKPQQRSNELRVLCDRPLVNIEEAAQTLTRSRPYRAADFIHQITEKDGTVNREGTVVDFSRTFDQGKGYNTRYRRPYTAPLEKPRPHRIETRRFNNFTEVYLLDFSHVRQNVLLPEHAYRIRFGFFVRVPTGRWFFSRHFLRSYNIHLLSYSERARVDLENEGLREVVDGSSLWIKMNRSEGLQPIIEALDIQRGLSAAEVESLCGQKVLDEPHSDVWIIVPKTWVLRRRPGKESHGPELSGTPDWMLFNSTLGRRSFHAYHWILGASEPYRDAPYLSAREDDVCELLLTPWWLRPIQQYPVWVAAVAIAISLVSRGWVTAIIIGAAVVALYFGMLWARTTFELPGGRE